jgi:hypothetical protein
MFPQNKQDDIVMVLHECDYDLAKATNMLVDGLSSFQDDWITAGTKKKPTPSSPNQANDEADVQPQNRSQHRPNGGLGKEKRQNRGDRDRDRDRERNRGENTKKERPRKTDSNAESNLEDKFNNLDVKDGESKFNNFSNGDGDQPNDHQRSNKRNSGGGRGGGGGAGRGPGSGGNRGTRNNGFGGERKMRENRGPRSDNRRSFNNRDQNPQTDEILGAGEGVELVVVSKAVETSSFESSNVANNASVIAPAISSEKTKLNELIETTKTSKSDSLRDIGTWTNEQADRNKSHNRQQQRFNANKQSGGAMNANKSVEDWENEEEWQGDLTKTQIFTSSNQKKDNVETKYVLIFLGCFFFMQKYFLNGLV